MAFNLADVLKDVSNSDIGREQIEYIRLDLIDEDPNNFYQLSDIPVLADNISLCGLQQPIRVRQKSDDPGRYIIVSGHRRRAALEMLVGDGYDQWQEAPCIVERDTVSPALQQLRLIYANANTRKMSPAEIGEQAEQVEKLLYRLKEEGYDFPGRMRDHVAEAVGASKSKLARLKVIRENLAPVWVDAYKAEQITESVAYALSQMPAGWQTIIHKEWGDNPISLHADHVTRSRDRFHKITQIQCDHGLTVCEHTAIMMEKSCREIWTFSCCGCCFDCANLRTCKSCCPQAVEKQKELKAAAAEARQEEKRQQEDKDRPGADFARMVYRRIGEARLANGVSVKELMEAQHKIYCESIDVPAQRKLESGKGNFTSNTYLPFGYSVRACNLMDVVAVADVLNCSVDYLLGRTERMALVSDSDTGWKTGQPWNLGEYAVLVRWTECARRRLEKMKWDGDRWNQYGEEVEIYPDTQIFGWIELPETDA